MYEVYILRSESTKKHYIGHSIDKQERLAQHNSGQVKSTKPYRPWVIVYSEVCDTKNGAYAREMQIKSYKGGRAFKALIESYGEVA